MKYAGLMLTLLLTLFFACKEEDDELAQNDNSIQNNQTGVKNTLFGETWVAQSAGGYYSPELFTISQRMELILFKEGNWNLCDSGQPYTTYLSVLFEPRLGKIELPEASDLIIAPQIDSARRNLSSIGTGSQAGQTNYLQIDVLDTVGVGFIKGSYHFTFTTYFGSKQSKDEVKGSFEAVLCRDANYLDYKDRPLAGKINNDDWSLTSGLVTPNGNNKLARLYGFPTQGDCTTPTDTFPRIEFAFNKYEVGNYSSTEPSQSDRAVAFYYYYDANQWDFLEGGLEITSIDAANQQLTGRIDAFTPFKTKFSNHDFPIELNGNFTLDYCQ